MKLKKKIQKNYREIKELKEKDRLNKHEMKILFLEVHLKIFSILRKEIKLPNYLKIKKIYINKHNN